MFSDSQVLYLVEVLGVEPAAFHKAAPLPAETPAEASETKGPLALWTKRLTEPERVLMRKIAGSVRLPEWVHEEHESLPQIAGYKSHLVFDSSFPQGRQEGALICGLPSLSEMLGAGAEVCALKKRVWEELKKFSFEVVD
jgi:hypothetical protein